MRPHRARAATAAAVLLVLGAALLPEQRVLLLQVAIAAAVPLLVLARLRRGSVRSPVGWALVVVLAGYGAGQVVSLHAGEHTPLSRGLLLAGQGLGLALLLPALLRRHRVARAGRAPVWWSELAVVAVGTAVGVLQITTSARRSALVHADPATALALGADVVVLSCLVWVLLQRRSRVVGASLLTAAGVALAVTDITAAFSGTAPGSPGSPVPVMHLVVVLLFAAGAAHPSTRALEAGGEVSQPRSATTRLVAVLPWGLMPLVSHLTGLADPAAHLPATWLLVASVLIFVLALLRAAGLLLAADRRSERDPLTGHLGRLGLERVLATAHEQGRRSHVVLLDLDGFKLVNDTRGHRVGDDLLRAVTARLADDLPRGTAVGRLGGDEVVVVVPVSGPVLVPEDSARMVHDAFERPFVVDGVAMGVSASTGAADLLSAPSAAAALSAADVAMYASKRGGRRRWTVDRPGLREEVLGPAELQEDLRRLLEDGPGAGALVLLYQPVVDLAGGLADGVEALVRWDHPVRGRLDPGAFVPLAEAAGLGAELDRRVTAAAAHQLAAWDRTGLVGTVRVGINLGVGSLSSPTLVDDVTGPFDAVGVDLSRVVLEVTEHALGAPGPDVVARLLALRGRGAGLALDDFGTGYASLRYLLEWPVDRVKLDRRLLPGALPVDGPGARSGDGTGDGPGDGSAPGAAGVALGSLVPAVVAMVHSVGLSVVVEGVETDEDLALAVAAGALRGQGHRFARPMDPGTLAVWWQRQHAGAADRAVAAPRPGGPDGGGSLHRAR